MVLEFGLGGGKSGQQSWCACGGVAGMIFFGGSLLGDVWETALLQFGFGGACGFG